MQEIAILALILALVFGAYWTMVVFPKQRDFQKRQQFVHSLSVGDEVITYGGIVGKVVSIETKSGIVHIEIADGVVVRFLAAALVQPYDPETVAQAARSGPEKHEEQTADNE